MGEVVLGDTSLMSFGKVPCTPVSGLHVNFYDIFGDVERIGTGSSWESSTGSISSGGGGGGESGGGGGGGGNGIEEQLDGGDADDMKMGRVRSNYCRKCKNDIYGPFQMDPYVLFLQEKEEEILKALHEEIRLLKRENSDLKFQVHVILCQQTRTNNNSPKTEDTTSATFGREKVSSLKKELQAAAKIIEEFKWLEQRYEEKIKMQGIMIQDLLRQQQESSRSMESVTDTQTETPISRLQSPQLMTSRPALYNRSSKSGNHNHRRVLQIDPTTAIEDISEKGRRSSIQSILPENYKEQVATLPPITNYEVFNNITPRKTIMSGSKLKHSNIKYEQLGRNKKGP